MRRKNIVNLVNFKSKIKRKYIKERYETAESVRGEFSGELEGIN